MNKDSLTAELLALAQVAPDDPTRSKAARLRAVLPAVEAALSAGTPREKVLEKLKEHGLDMTLAVFNTTLRRVRAARDKAGQSPAPALPPAEPVAQVEPKPDAKPPARSVPRVPLIPDLGSKREPDDMADLINHARKDKS